MKWIITDVNTIYEDTSGIVSPEIAYLEGGGLIVNVSINGEDTIGVSIEVDETRAFMTWKTEMMRPVEFGALNGYVSVGEDGSASIGAVRKDPLVKVDMARSMTGGLVIVVHDDHNDEPGFEIAIQEERDES